MLAFTAKRVAALMADLLAWLASVPVGVGNGRSRSDQEDAYEIFRQDLQAVVIFLSRSNAGYSVHLLITMRITNDLPLTLLAGIGVRGEWCHITVMIIQKLSLS